MAGLRLATVEATIGVVTTLSLIAILSRELWHLKVVLSCAMVTLFLHEAYLSHNEWMDRLPSGLTQGCLLLPWLLSSICQKEIPSLWRDGLCLCALIVGMSLGLISLAVLSRNGKQRAAVILCMTGYVLTLFLSCTLLQRISKEATEPRFWFCILVWISLVGIILTAEIQYFAECFSLGEMLVSAELLATLLLSAATTATSQISIIGGEAVDAVPFVTYSVAMAFVFSLFMALAVREWTVDRLHRIHGLAFHKRQNQAYSSLVHGLGLWGAWRLAQTWSSWLEIAVVAVTSPRRRLLIIYWMGVLASGIWSAQILKSRTKNIVMRKWFHFIALALFVPALLTDRVFLQLALGSAQVIFSIVEGIRVASLPWISAKIDHFLAPFTDHRDNGPMIYSHFSLLFGLALPICIAHLIATDATEATRLALSGLTGLGIGDSFAAIVGTWYGKSHWMKGMDKSVEGSIAFFMTTMIGWILLSHFAQIPVAKCILPTVAACIFEASSSQNDNLFLPIYYLTMIKIF